MLILFNFDVLQRLLRQSLRIERNAALWRHDQLFIHDYILLFLLQLSLKERVRLISIVLINLLFPFTQAKLIL